MPLKARRAEELHSWEQGFGEPGQPASMGLGFLLCSKPLPPAFPVSGGGLGFLSPHSAGAPPCLQEPRLGQDPLPGSYWGPRGILAQPPVRGAGSLSISVHMRAFPGSAHPTSMGQFLPISGQFFPPQTPSPHETGKSHNSHALAKTRLGV